MSYGVKTNSMELIMIPSLKYDTGMHYVPMLFILVAYAPTQGFSIFNKPASTLVALSSAGTT